VTPRTCLPLALIALCAAGCAHTPATSSNVSPELERERRAAIDSHSRQARELQQRGDLAASELQWHLVSLLAPRDETVRNERAALQAAIAKAAADAYQAGMAALRRGDSDAAAPAMLRTLALTPDHAEAAQVLRDIEKQRMARIQAERAAKARRADTAAVARAPKTPSALAESRQSVDLEQRIDLFTSGDYSSGLREMQSYLDANPEDRAARRRMVSLVDQEARRLEARGERDKALGLYEQAAAMRGASADERARALRQALGAEYYDKGLRAYQSDIGLAIRHWETALRYDPTHAAAAIRLREARVLQSRLKAIDSEPAR